jgi:hypothetical protein
MLNLTKRVHKLVEKTTSLETKDICKEVLETYTNVPSEQLETALVEKLKGVKDGDKHVAAFIKSATKAMKIKDLGVAKAISKIRESQTYHYPALRYALDRFERAKINEGVQDFLLVEDFLTSLKDFVWDANVKESLDSVRESYESEKEAVLVSKAIFEFRKAKGNFLFEKVCEMLEDHFENPTDASRSAVIEALTPFSYNGTAKALAESLKKIQNSSKPGALNIIAENNNCEVSPVYSTIFVENGKEYFTIKGDVFKKEGSLVEKVTPEEFQSLSENVKRSYSILTANNFFVKEGKASFYIGRNKIEISEGENSTKVLFNGKPIASTEIAKSLVSTGMLRLEEAKIASDVQFVNDIFENFYEIDFAKTISSKIYEGSFVTLMKIDENIYVNKVNTSMKTNEFFSGLNATQARNLVLEFLGYDIKESMVEFLEKEETEILAIKEEQANILKNVTILEGEITKLTNAKKDAFIAAQPQVVALEEMLSKELQALKEKYSELSSKLKKFEAKASDAGVEIGQDVKLADSGELATVTAIDSNTKQVTVVTGDGKTKDFPLNKVVSVEKAEESAVKKNEEKADEEAEKEPTPPVEDDEKVEEATLNLAGATQVPVEDPNKDKLQSQAPEPQPAKVVDENHEYVPGKVDAAQEGSCAGKDVEVLAADFASKGPEDLIQVKCDGELFFIEKKFVQVSTTEAEDSLTIDFDAAPPAEDEKKEEEPKEEEPKEEAPKEEEPKAEGGEEAPKEEAPKEEAPKEEPKEEAPKEEEPKEEAPKEEAPKAEDGEEEKKKPSLEELQAKLAKALEDLESIKNDMKDTFTSNEAISATITSLKGLNDALKKDLNESN